MARHSLVLIPCSRVVRGHPSKTLVSPRINTMRRFSLTATLIGVLSLGMWTPTILAHEGHASAPTAAPAPTNYGGYSPGGSGYGGYAAPSSGYTAPSTGYSGYTSPSSTY